MNYIKLYDSLILNAKNKNRKKLNKNNKNYIYYEKHHIIPKCVGGSDDNSNLVLLTAKEHYLAHKLLIKIYSGNRKIALAYHRMTFDKKHDQYICSRDYEYAKELISSTICSEETRQKQRNKKMGKSAAIKGRKLITKNDKKKYVYPSEIDAYILEGWKYKIIMPKEKYNHSEITKNLMRKKALGRKASKETKQILSKSHIGISPGNKGKIAVYKNNEKTYIEKNKLEEYLINGWNCKNPYKRKQR